MCEQKAKKKGGRGWFHITSACGGTNKELVFNQCCLNFPLINAIVTRWPRCATFSIEISYIVFITLSCQRFYLQWINAFGILDLSFITAAISCVKHMDFCLKFDDENWNLNCNPNCPYSFIKIFFNCYGHTLCYFPC
jgi:hypothetical protein